MKKLIESRWDDILNSLIKDHEITSVAVSTWIKPLKVQQVDETRKRAVLNKKQSSKPILTIYVSPARYTHEFLEESEYFTVSFFPEEYRRDLSLLGSRSGRDGDKVAQTGLTPVALEHGVDFAQAELSFVCRKLYAHQFEKEQVPQEVADWIYTRVPPHTMFIGEIVEAIER